MVSIPHVHIQSMSGWWFQHVSTPLKNDGLRQLGWWLFPIYGKIIQPCSSHHQPDVHSISILFPLWSQACDGTKAIAAAVGLVLVPAFPQCRAGAGTRLRKGDDMGLNGMAMAHQWWMCTSDKWGLLKMWDPQSSPWVSSFMRTEWFGGAPILRNLHICIALSCDIGRNSSRSSRKHGIWRGNNNLI